MENYIDIELSLEVVNLLIKVNRENLCWLMHHVSCEREDAWRDKKFHEIQDKIVNLIMEREMLLESLNKNNA